MNVVQATGLNSGYGKYQVLYDINFTAKAKEITVIVGPNGSGKSTLLKSIMGLTTHYSGTVEYEGSDITEMAPHERANNGMAYLPQTESVFSTLTVRENLKMSGHALSPEEFETQVDFVAEVYPIIKECYAHLECKLANTFSIGDHTFFIGEVVNIQLDENSFKDNILNNQKTQPTYYLGSNTYTTINKAKKKF